MRTNNLLRKMPSFIFALLIIMLPISCKKNNLTDQSSLPQGLTGTWVETHTNSDTLLFSSDNDTGMVVFQRGYEMRNGYRLPTIGSTIYSYTILSDSIKMRDGLSSYWSEDIYYFQFDDQNLIINIGKFSKYIDTSEDNLTFRKIK